MLGQLKDAQRSTLHPSGPSYLIARPRFRRGCPRPPRSASCFEIDHRLTLGFTCGHTQVVYIKDNKGYFSARYYTMVYTIGLLRDPFTTLWNKELGLVFQDPLTTPVYEQIGSNFAWDTKTGHQRHGIRRRRRPGASTPHPCPCFSHT